MNTTDNSLDEIYENSEKRKHSKFMNKYFNLSKNGIDYKNHFGILFELKETYAKKYIRFMIPKKQVIEANYFMFNFHEQFFCIVDSNKILKKFKDNNEMYYPNENTVKKLAFFLTKDIECLRTEVLFTKW